MTIFERIKETARERGYSLTKVNEEAKLGKNIIYSWKTKKPSAVSLSKVADVLNVSVDYLLGNTDEKNSTKKADSRLVDDLDPAKVEFVNKISKENLNEKQLEELDDFLEYLKVKYVKDMREIENDERKN